MKSNRKSVNKSARRSTLRGKGDYTEEIKSILKPLPRLEAKIDHLERALNPSTISKSSAAKTIGRTLGNFINQGDLGAFAGESLAKLFGHGDYHVKSNSLVSASGPTIPKFSNRGRGTRITEREFLTDISSGALISGSSEFTNTVYPITPRDRNSFPWLSTIASQYDNWEVHGIVYEFVSTSSEFNGTSQALGAVIMATDYDVLDSPYQSKQTMENADYSCSTRPACNLIHGVECDPRERPLRVMYVNEHTTPQFSTLGNFQIATVGCSTEGAKLGELWVSYDITFYKKQLVGPTSSLNIFAATGTTAVGTGLIRPPFLIANDNNSIRITQNVGVGSVVNFPPSQGRGSAYLIIYYTNAWSGESPAWTTSNCTMSYLTSFNSIPNNHMDRIVVQLTAPGATLTTPLKLLNGSDYHITIIEYPLGE